MGDRIKLLYFIPGLETGGTERLVVDCATGLDPKRFQVSVAVLASGPLGAELKRQGIDVVVITEGTSPATRLGRILMRRRRVRALARDADIIHTHHLGPLLSGAVAGFPRRPWKWVHTEHTRPDTEIIYESWLISLDKMLFHLPDALTGVSPAVTGYFVSRSPSVAQRCRTIMNGIHVDRFRSGDQRDIKRRELGISLDGWVIGTVGNLRPQKNHALLLQAFSRLLSSAPNAWLVLVGDGDCRGQLQRLAVDLQITNRVLLLGARHDVAELLGSFDVYCLSSHYEGMPLSILEAMASELPVVATAVTGIREVVQHGETGLLVTPDDCFALAEALIYLRNEPVIAARIGSAGREYVEKHGRFEVMLEGYSQLYESLIMRGH